MNVLTGVWPLGTVKSVRVLRVFRSKPTGCQVLACWEEATDEPIVLVMARESAPIEAGETGIITYRRGGPTGAHWDFTRGSR